MTNGAERRRPLTARARPSGRPAARQDDVELLRQSFDSAPIPHLVLDTLGRVTHLNGMARRLFRLTERDVGRPFQDLEVSFRPIELRSSISTAQRERCSVVHRDIEFGSCTTPDRYLDIEVMPLYDQDGAASGVGITFDDVTWHRELQDELAHSKRQLEGAYEELQSTNEELETTHEELQSTVEELETTNEELQSTNDEPHVVNEELRLRRGQLNSANDFLESILSALRRAVVVLDHDLIVQVWNDKAEDLWGLRREEVLGQHFLTLDIGIAADGLRAALRRALAGPPVTEEIRLPARNRRGQPIECTSVVSSRISADGTIAGVLMLMEPGPPDAADGT